MWNYLASQRLHFIQKASHRVIQPFVVRCCHSKRHLRDIFTARINRQQPAAAARLPEEQTTRLGSKRVFTFRNGIKTFGQLFSFSLALALFLIRKLFSVVHAVVIVVVVVVTGVRSSTARLSALQDVCSASAQFQPKLVVTKPLSLSRSLFLSHSDC